MATWLNVLWGVCGALAMDGLDISNHVRRRHCFPWRDPRTKQPLWRTEYLVMVLINAGVGGLAAGAMALTAPHGISPWVAVGLGAGGMATLQKASGHIPLTESQDESATGSQHPSSVNGSRQINGAHYGFTTLSAQSPDPAPAVEARADLDAGAN
jgi:hypothetical protein